jgi:hypothetical protein
MVLTNWTFLKGSHISQGFSEDTMLSLIWVVTLIRTIESALVEYISFFGMITKLFCEDSRNRNIFSGMSDSAASKIPRGGPTRLNDAEGQHAH